MRRSGKPTVLYVDHEPESRRLFDLEFTSLGIPHYVADNPESAVHILVENDVDIVVTDTVVPSNDGTDLLDFVRRWSAPFPPLIIYFMTARDPAKVVHALNAGATSVMVRPLATPSTLVERIYSLTKDGCGLY